MNSSARAVIAAMLTFAGALVGFSVQWLAPTQNVAEANGVTGSIVGLVTLLFVLVLGLLLWMSYSLFVTQNRESQSLGPLILKLDLALEQYGPEARRGRELLRAAVVRARDRFWGAARRESGASPYAQARSDLQEITAFFARLEPVTDQQKRLITTAMPIFTQVVEITLLMTRQLENRVPKLLIFMLIGWSALLFVAYGLLGALNALGFVAVALGSIAVAGAVFLIFEFNQPYSGVIRISPVGVDNLIAILGA